MRRPLLYIARGTNFLQTALHKATLHGWLDVIQFLISKGAEVHAQDADGWTALHNACSKVRNLHARLCH
jgi:ankyrin repeat protein